MTPLRLLALGSAAIAWHGAALPGAWAQTPRAETAANSNDFFESKIRPILATRCYSCHSASSKMRFANLLLDSREAMLRGGDHGPVVEPGSPEASRLLQAVKYQGLRMPPAAKLPDAEIADLERWIRIGAPWPAERSTATASAKAGGARKPHWSWQPLRRDFPPGSSIDAFARTALARSGIAANPEANRRALIRRVSYDVTGLPPSASAIDAFEADADPRAYERLVDGLLASPRFGERWGRHWLDLARFSDAGFNNVRFLTPSPIATG
ncbi:MAG: DUF1549 domain-containing protein [Bryobacteraceae bacterium]